MNVALRKPRMTGDEFLGWVQTREGRYEFDGSEPVAMVGGTANHSRIAQNIYRAAFEQLYGTPCEPFIQDGGVATIADAIRYPDVVITCTPTPGGSRLIPNPLTVFEVLSPSTGLTGRITKVEEYLAVRSIQTYVIVEQDAMALTAFRRQANDTWSATILKAGDTLQTDAPNLKIPVAAFYERVEMLAAPTPEA